MSATIAIKNAAGSVTRLLSTITGQDSAVTFSATRSAEEGFAGFTLSFPADWDENTDIVFGDRVECSYGGNLHYRGYVTSIHRSWKDTATPQIELKGFGIAKAIYALEAPGSYNWLDSPLDRGDAWNTVAEDTLIGLFPSLELDFDTIGLVAERLDCQYKEFRSVVSSLRSAAEDLIVAGGDAGGTGGADRLFFHLASSSADYTFPIPDTALNPQTHGLTGGISADGIFNRIRYRGGTPIYPQLWPNALFDRVTGYGATIAGSYGTVVGAVADGVEAVALGSASITSQQWDYADYTTGYQGKNSLKISGLAADVDNLDIVLQMTGQGTITLAYPEQSLTVELLLKGTWPKILREVEWLDSNGHRIGALPDQSSFAGATYGSWTGVSHTFTAPTGAVAACVRIRVRGNVTNGLLGAISVRDSAADTDEWINNGAYTTVVTSDDSDLLALGISAAAAASKTNYTGGAYRTHSVSDETVCTRAGALANAALWFNRYAVPIADPSFCRRDDATVYMPGQAAALTGLQGAAAMGGADYLPIDSVAISAPGNHCDFEQRISLKRPEITSIEGLAADLAASTRQILVPQLASISSVSSPGAAGGGMPNGGGGNIGPTGFRPPFMFPTPQTFDAIGGTVNEYGTFTAIGPAAEGTGEGSPSAASTRPGLQCVFVTKPTPDAIAPDDTATDTHVTQFKGSLTGFTLTALDDAGEPVAVTSATVTVDRAPFDPEVAIATYSDVTGGTPPTLAASDTAEDTTLSGWSVDFEEGDEFKFALTEITGSAYRLELFIDVTVDNQYAAPAP